MLKQRITTAILMLVVLLPALIYSDTRAFGLVATLLIAAAMWEWARLAGLSSVFGLCTAMTFGVIAGGAIWVGNIQPRFQMLWAISTALWFLLGAALLRLGAGYWSKLPGAVCWATGIGALAVAWLAVIQARAMGMNFLLSVMVLVWVADIGAYFAGRSFGGKWFETKLAPSISPGKTWEGAIGGMVCVFMLAVSWRWLDSHFEMKDLSLFTHLGNFGALCFTLSVIALGVMSVVGDLVESLIKRAAGVKDSSGLLPGHGGVLDRIDALLPVLPIALFFANL